MCCMCVSFKFLLIGTNMTFSLGIQLLMQNYFKIMPSLTIFCLLRVSLHAKNYSSLIHLAVVIQQIYTLITQSAVTQLVEC